MKFLLVALFGSLVAAFPDTYGYGSVKSGSYGSYAAKEVGGESRINCDNRAAVKTGHDQSYGAYAGNNYYKADKDAKHDDKHDGYASKSPNHDDAKAPNRSNEKKQNSGSYGGSGSYGANANANYGKDHHHGGDDAKESHKNC